MNYVLMREDIYNDWQTLIKTAPNPVLNALLNRL